MSRKKRKENGDVVRYSDSDFIAVTCDLLSISFYTKGHFEDVIQCAIYVDHDMRNKLIKSQLVLCYKGARILKD